LLDVLMIEPRRACFMPGTTARTHRKAPRKLTPKVRSQISAVVRSTGYSTMIPATFASTSTQG